VQACGCPPGYRYNGYNCIPPGMHGPGLDP
jgi:hypothetical protein